MQKELARPDLGEAEKLPVAATIGASPNDRHGLIVSPGQNEIAQMQNASASISSPIESA